MGLEAANAAFKMFIFKNLRCLQPPHLHICLTMSAQPLNGRLLQQRLKQFRLPESKTKTFCLKLLIQHWSHRRYWFRAYRLQFTWSCSYLKSSNLPQLFTFQSKAVPTFHWNTQSVVEYAKVVPFFQWRAFRSLRTAGTQWGLQRLNEDASEGRFVYNCTGKRRSMEGFYWSNLPGCICYFGAW